MPRKPDIDRPRDLHLMIPESVLGRLDLHLFSQVEGRVPKGAYRAFFIERIQEFFGWRTLEVGPGLFIRGSEEALFALTRKLDALS